jgi:hypothetical protein
MFAFKIFFILVGYTIACFGAGALVLRVLSVPPASRKTFSAGTELATAFILGQGVLASLWLLLALAHSFSPIIVILGTAVCVLISAVLLLPCVGDFTKQARSICSELRADTWVWQVIGILTLLLGLAWVTSLGRGITGDASAFYMALPKVIAASHRLVPLPGGYEAFTSFGLQGELHYAALMDLGSPDAAQLFAWPTILAGAAMLLALGRQVGLGRRGQWITLAILFTSSAVYMLSGDGKTDLFAAALGLAAYYWILQIRCGSQRLASWLTGLFCGFAIVAKLSYIPVMAPGMVLLLVWGFRENLLDSNQRKKNIIAFLTLGFQILAGLLIALTPHLIQNALLYHNPIAPFGMSNVSETWFGLGTTHRIVLTYPLALTFGNYWGQYGDLSPLLLAFLPLALLLPRVRNWLLSPLSAVTLAATAGIIIWIFLQPSDIAPRYMLATLLLFALLPARAVEYVSQNDVRPGWLAFWVMLCTITTLVAVGLLSLNSVFFPESTYRYLSGKMPDCYREGQSCQAMVAINHDAAPGARVFLASYYRYWLRADLLQCLSTQADLDIDGTPAVKWQTFYQRGFSYLLVDRSTQGIFLNGLDLANPPSWLKLVVLFQNDSIAVYRLYAIRPPSRQVETCRQVDPPSWDVVLR